jgi:hypothetical protein
MSDHVVRAVSFAENLPLRELVASFPEGTRTARALRLDGPGAASSFLFPFGAAAFSSSPSCAEPRAPLRGVTLSTPEGGGAGRFRA